MSTTAGHSTLLSLSGAVVALAVAISACQQGGNPQPQQSPPAPSSAPQAESTITLEVTGSGEVYSIWAIPFNQLAGDHTTVPFSKGFPLPADVNSVSLTWTSRDSDAKGCKITVDGKVVVEQPLGTKEDCVFER